MRFETRTIGVFEVLSVQLANEEVFDAGRLRQETLRLVEKGSRRIVVDLGGVDYLYSDSINALVALNRRMLESSGRMGILVPHPKVYDILVRAGLENIMRLYRSEAELQSDSRELMRQSSAWTRPAELLSAATASQVLSASVLSPKNPSDLRDAASASQRIPRRRVGSRVELKPRRRGGRGMDQDPPTAEFQLPPALPALPGESTTLRTLSQDSSAFDQQPTFSKSPKAHKAPKTPVQPRQDAPPAAEPTVFHVPENTAHDGYSTDAWLLSLTSPKTATPTTPENIVADAAAGSSSFLPKVAGSTDSPLRDVPSKFATEFAWDESEISLTDSVGIKPNAGSPSPLPPQAPPVSPWLNQPADLAPNPPAAKTAPVAPPSVSAPPSAKTSAAPSLGSPFLEAPHSSAFLDDSAAGSTITTHSNPGLPAAPRTASPPIDPWLTPAPAAARTAPQPDIQSAIFHDHPSAPTPKPTPTPLPPAASAAPQAPIAPSPTSGEQWFSGTTAKPNATSGAKPSLPNTAPAGKGSTPAPQASAAPSPESWFAGSPSKPAPAPVAKSEPAPQQPAPSSPGKSGSNSLEAWFGAGAANPSTTPAKPTPRSTGAAPSASALDWVTPTSKPVADVPTPKAAAPTKPAAAAADPWILPSPSPTPPVAKRAAPSPAPAPAAQAAGLDSWISPSSGVPSVTPPTPAPSDVKPAQSSKPQASAVDSWITATPSTAAPKPAAQPTPSKPAPSNKDAAIGGTAWLESTKPHRKTPVGAPKEPTTFLDLEDLEAQPSNKKPLWFAIGGLALVALVGLAIFFFGGSKKGASDVPPSTTPGEALTSEPTPGSTAVEPATGTADSKETAEDAETPTKAKNKAKATKPDKKPENKPKEKAAAEKVAPKAKETAKPVPVAAPAPVPEEVHAPVKIFVTSRPTGAQVTLDGARMGVTPCEVTFKRVGKLEFSLAGYRKQVKDIDPEETRGTVNVQLSADGGNSGTGRIYISSAPIGAEIVVAGKVVGKTPKLVELPTGSQKVTVRSGVLSKTKTVDIQSGTNTAENFSL